MTLELYSEGGVCEGFPDIESQKLPEPSCWGSSVSLGRLLLLDQIKAVPSVFSAAQGLRLLGPIFSLCSNRPSQQKMNGALVKVMQVPRTLCAGEVARECRAGMRPRPSKPLQTSGYGHWREQGSSQQHMRCLVIKGLRVLPSAPGALGRTVRCATHLP